LISETPARRANSISPRVCRRRKDDAVRRNARGQGAANLALGDGVRSRAEVAQDLEHRDVAVGLDRVGDQRIAQARQHQGVTEDGVVPLQRGAGIDIDRRAHGPGDPAEGRILAMELAAPDLEVVHAEGTPGSKSPALTAPILSSRP